MRKLVVALQFLAVWHLSVLAQADSNIVILNMLEDNNETFMIDHTGKIITTFGAGERCKIEDEMQNTFTVFSLEKNFAMFDFTQGHLPVAKDRKWKFFNRKGEMIKDFADRFHAFTTPIEGTYRAYEKIEGEGNGFLIVYLNQDFEELFAGKRFWQATNLKGGYAFIQLESENGPWAILDRSSGNVKMLDTLLSKSIRKITKNAEGLGVIQYNGYGGTGIINQYGVVTKPNGGKPKLTREQQEIADNLQVCVNNHSYATDIGIGILHANFIPKLRSQNSELEWGMAYSHKFIPSWMSLKKQEFFFCNVASDQYFGGLVIDTVKKEKKYSYYDYLNQKISFTSTKLVEYIYGNRFFVTKPKASGYGSNLVEILDQQGNTIYGMPATQRLFIGISSTLEFNSDEIHKLYVSKDEDLNALKNFQNIRHIEFDRFSFVELPRVLSTFEHLESLKLSDCSNLKELPTWLSSAKNLKKIDITDCAKLKNLEAIIKASSTLEQIVTQNYSYEKGFGKLMKETRPNLKFKVTFEKKVKLE